MKRVNSLLPMLRLLKASMGGAVLLLLSLASLGAAETPTLPVVSNVEWQPLAASVRRLIEATEFLGAPLRNTDQQALNQLLKNTADTDASRGR